MDKVSCIVPAYNKEQYIKKCILSLMHQSYENIEIILINDGSTDNTRRILDKMALKDPRIIVIHKENEGVSAARNLGLKNASGKYVCFVDSDDWLPVKAIENLVRGIKRGNADFCSGNMTRVTPRGVKAYAHVSAQYLEPKKDLRGFAKAVVEMDCGSCSKLYKKEKIDKYSIHFPEGVKVYEDAIFLREYLGVCNGIEFIDESVYYYNKLVMESTTGQPGRHEPLDEWLVMMLDGVLRLFADKMEIVEDILLPYIKKVVQAGYTYIYLSSAQEDEKIRRMERLQNNISKSLSRCVLVNKGNVSEIVTKPIPLIYEELSKEQVKETKRYNFFTRSSIRLLFKRAYFGILRFLVFKLNILFKR